MLCCKLSSGWVPLSAYLEVITDVNTCIPLQICSSAVQELWRLGVTVTSTVLGWVLEKFSDFREPKPWPGARFTTVKVLTHQRLIPPTSLDNWILWDIMHSEVNPAKLVVLSLRSCPAFHWGYSYSLTSRWNYLGLLPYCSPHTLNSRPEIACRTVKEIACRRC